MADADYVELHARSAFSFLQGASTPEEYIAVCQELHLPAIALLDRDGVYGIPRLHMAAKRNEQKGKVRAHVGAEITLYRWSSLSVAGKKPGRLPKSLPSNHPDEIASSEAPESRPGGGCHP